MWNKLFATDSANHSLLVQRAVLGAVILPHGAQKLLGWFGGGGYAATMSYLVDVVHLPAPLALLVILGETVGALALIAGLGTRVAALGITAIMAGAIATTHAEHGFFMNWFGAQAGEGFEYHLLALALSVPLVIRGGGALAVDGKLAAWRRSQLRRGADPLGQPGPA